MKKFLMISILSLCFMPVYAAEVQIPPSESIKNFTQPNDARFQYDFPSVKNFKFKKEEKSTEINDEEAITLDPSEVKPVKKVIKKLEPNSVPSYQDVSTDNVPMNYDSFPKFYDNNDMMQQQIMPMFQ